MTSNYDFYDDLFPTTKEWEDVCNAEKKAEQIDGYNPEEWHRRKIDIAMKAIQWALVESFFDVRVILKDINDVKEYNKDLDFISNLNDIYDYLSDPDWFDEEEVIYILKQSSKDDSQYLQMVSEYKRGRNFFCEYLKSNDISKLLKACWLINDRYKLLEFEDVESIVAAIYDNITRENTFNYEELVYYKKITKIYTSSESQDEIERVVENYTIFLHLFAFYLKAQLLPVDIIDEVRSFFSRDHMLSCLFNEYCDVLIPYGCHTQLLKVADQDFLSIGDNTISSANKKDEIMKEKVSLSQSGVFEKSAKINTMKLDLPASWEVEKQFRYDVEEELHLPHNFMDIDCLSTKNSEHYEKTWRLYGKDSSCEYSYEISAEQIEKMFESWCKKRCFWRNKEQLYLLAYRLTGRLPADSNYKLLSKRIIWRRIGDKSLHVFINGHFKDNSMLYAKGQSFFVYDSGEDFSSKSASRSVQDNPSLVKELFS